VPVATRKGSTGAKLPTPPVPADCDMGGLFFPVHVGQLLKSRLWLRSRHDPCIGFAAVSLWCESWQQVPAASLPDDDELLAEFARCNADAWARVKPHVLRLFVKCSDGRLYHRVVAAQALIAWKKRAALREQGRDGASVRWRGGGEGNGGAIAGPSPGHSGANAHGPLAPLKRGHSVAIAGPSPGHSGANGQTMPELLPGHSPAIVGPWPDHSGANAGLGLGFKDSDNPFANAQGLSAAAAFASAAPTPRDAVFALGVPLLEKAGTSEKHARSMLALAAKLHGEAAVVNAINACAVARPVDPVSWLQATLRTTVAGHSKSDRIARHNAEVVARMSVDKS